MALSLSNINIRSHSLYVFPLSATPLLSFSRIFRASLLRFFFSLLRLSANRKTARFFFSSRCCLLSVIRSYYCRTNTRFFLFIVSHPRSVSFPRMPDGWPRRVCRPLFLFWRRRRERGALMKISLSRPPCALTSGRLENAWRYFCARTASSMYFHISAVGALSLRALSPSLSRR